MVIGQEMDDLDRAFDSGVEPVQYAGDGSAGADQFRSRRPAKDLRAETANKNG